MNRQFPELRSGAAPHPTGAVSRRAALAGIGAAGGIALLAVTPLPVRAAVAEISERLAAILDSRLGGRGMNDGRVVLGLPDRADTGLSVPATISVPDSPMTEADHVRSLHIFTELNPQLEVADYYLSRRSGKAEVSTRMRLAQTQNVFALAILSDDTVWATSVKVTVTLGACAAEIFLPDQNEALRDRLRARGGG